MTRATTTTTASECSRPLVRLTTALIITLVGFLIAVMGFVVDKAPMIVTGTSVGGSAWIAVNGLAKVVNRWRPAGRRAGAILSPVQP